MRAVLITIIIMIGLGFNDIQAQTPFEITTDTAISATTAHNAASALAMSKPDKSVGGSAGAAAIGTLMVKEVTGASIEGPKKLPLLELPTKAITILSALIDNSVLFCVSRGFKKRMSMHLPFWTQCIQQSGFAKQYKEIIKFHPRLSPYQFFVSIIRTDWTVGQEYIKYLLRENPRNEKAHAYLVSEARKENPLERRLKAYFICVQLEASNWLSVHYPRKAVYEILLKGENFILETKKTLISPELLWEVRLHRSLRGKSIQAPIRAIFDQLTQISDSLEAPTSVRAEANLQKVYIKISDFPDCMKDDQAYKLSDQLSGNTEAPESLRVEANLQKAYMRVCQRTNCITDDQADGLLVQVSRSSQVSVRARRAADFLRNIMRYQDRTNHITVSLIQDDRSLLIQHLQMKLDLHDIAYSSEMREIANVLLYKVHKAAEL